MAPAADPPLAQHSRPTTSPAIRVSGQESTVKTTTGADLVIRVNALIHKGRDHVHAVDKQVLLLPMKNPSPLPHSPSRTRPSRSPEDR